ncbi:MAG: FtsW/RodA/SpoVE family cell cycle protein [Oscillospiraceae bacterium]|nr:FtsW/RodA/SpoVE family cell cycle protein [Oscillospiraceae bacterium]
MKQILNNFLNYLKRLDILLILLCLSACFLSTYILYSMVQNEVSVFARARHYQMQLAMTFMGLVAALVIAAINYKYISRFWYVGAVAGLTLMFLLFTPLGLQTEGSEEVNWLNVGFTAIQPSEFLKFFFVISFSTHLAKIGKKMNRIPHLALLIAHAAVPVLLVLSRGDFGTTLVFIFIIITMLFIAGLWWRYIALGVAFVPVAAFVMWNYIFKPYHKLRILVLIDEEIRDSEMLGFFNQQHRSLVAIGSGELTGKGLFNGDYIYVPAFQTDFIFSYIGMTLGFVGCVITLGLIASICLRILSNCLIAKDTLGKYMCVGVFSMFLYNTIINVGMTLAVIPVIGQPMPFISAGGSSVLAYFLGIGLVLSVRAHRFQKYHMFYKERE